MLVIIIVLLLVSSFVGGVFLFMNNRGGEEVGNTGEIIVTSSDTKSSSAQETDKQDNESSTKKTSTKILEIGYPKARYVRVSKNALIEKWEERPIVLNEVYVYGKDGKNIALKKPVATNSSGKETLSAFNDGDEMTLGNTVSSDKNNNQLQRQNIEIDLGSMQEIQSVVLLMKGIDKGLLVTLFDDKLKDVSMTRELTIEDTNKGSKHKFDFGTSKWSVLPVDCVGKWSEWSKCSASCVTDGSGSKTGTQKRDWITLRKAENGGKACVYDLNKDGAKECKTSAGTWTSWSGCQRDPMKCKGFKYKKFELTEEGSDGGLGCPRGLDGVRVLPCVSKRAGVYSYHDIDCDSMYYRVHKNPYNPNHQRVPWMIDEDLYASIQNLDKGVIGTTQEYLGIIKPDTRPYDMCEGNWNRYAYAKTGKIPGVNDYYPKCSIVPKDRYNNPDRTAARKLDLEMIEKEKEFTATNPKPFRKITL
jgi:hypothetical protein